MAKAINVPASQYWEGNDGPWSTFAIEVGSPAQQVRVLPATSQSNVWVVWNFTQNGALYSGCPHGSPKDCADRRGVLFDPTSSGSFDLIQPDNQDKAFQLPFVSTESSLPGYNGSSLAGYDRLSLPNGPTLPHQVISAYGDNIPFIGLLGLNIQGPNPSKNLSASQNSTLGALWGTNQVPSRYFAYTAGAQYTIPPVLGSLTFGGYDALRRTDSAVLTVPLGKPSDRDLQVAVSDITITTGTNSVSAPSFTALPFIDSVVPELWLPVPVCKTFESAFGLQWNDTSKMYLVNETHHETLLSQNSTVKIKLTAPGPNPSTGSTEITLPYLSFNLSAQYPRAGILDDSSVYYFPLKQASTDNQVILGRTFLQQAYLQVDYDRQQFDLSPALFPASPDKTDIQTVYPPGYSTGLSTGATAGIAVGAIAVFAVLAGVIAWLCIRRKREQRRRRNSAANRSASIGPLSTLVADDEVREYFQKSRGSLQSGENDFKAELDAQQTARGSPTQRFELDACGGQNIRPSPHPTISWGSGVSSLEERMRGYSFGSSTSPVPSPPLSQHGRHKSIEEQGEFFAPHNRHKSIEEQGELFEMAAL